MPDASQMEKRQKVLADFGEFALRSDDLDAVLTEACRLVAGALGTGRAKVLEIVDEGRTLFVRAGVGWDEGVVGRVRLPMVEPSSETYSIEAGEPVITNDLASEDRFDFPAFMKEAGVRALANVPIFLPGGKPFGLLQVDAPEPRAFGDEDTQFLRIYATILGPVIDRLIKVQTLSATEERFRTIVEAARDYAIVITDPQDRITDWLPGAEAVFGWTAEEAIGQPGAILFTPEDRQAGAPEAEVRAARETSSAPNVRWHLRKDGSRVFIEGSVVALRDEAGGLLGFQKIGQDVTKRRLAEEALRDREEKYRTLFDAIDEGLAIVEMIYDDRGEITDMIFREVNAAYGRQGGISDVVGRPVSAILPGIEEVWLDRYRQVAKTGQPLRVEDYQQDVDRWFDIYFSQVDRDGRFVAIVFNDISERKRAEAELREREERQAFLLKLSDILQRLTAPNDIKTAAMHMLGSHLGVSRAQYHEVDSSGEYYTADGIGYADGLPLLDLKYRIDQFGSFVAEDFEAGRPFRSADLLADPRPSAEERDAYGFYGIRAGAGIPLLRGGKLVAILAVHDMRPHPWTDLEMELIRETAERVWVAVEKIRTAIALREREERQAFLLKLSDALRPLADPVELQSEAARVLGAHLGAGRAAYAEIAADDTHFTVHRDYTDGVPSFAGCYPCQGYGSAEMWESLRAGRTISVADAERDERLGEADRVNYAAGKVRAATAVPLVEGGRLAAVFFLHFPVPHDWTPDELALVEETAERTWAAMVRARAEEALRESEEKYRTLFEEMDEGFVVCELVRDDAGRAVDFRYIDLNPAVSHHVGIAPEALRGRRATEAFPDRDPWYLETYAHVVDSGQSVLEEHHFEHVDRWLRINVFPRGGDRFAVLYSDITDRKRVETVLRERERRQAFLLRFTDAIRSEPSEQALIERAVRMLAEELAVDRVYATRHYPAQDLTNVVFEVRGPDLAPLPATLRFSDFPEAGRQTFHRTLVFDDTASDPSLTDADKASLTAMGVGAFLSRPLRRDGSPIFALGAVSTLPRRWTPAEIALVEEATERTWEAAERARAEAALRASEERYAGLFAASPAPILILRPDAPHFTIEDVNGAYLAATMQTREDLVGRAMFDAFPDNPDDPAADGESNLRAALERALVSRRSELMDVQKYDIARPDGTFEERWWKPANSPVVDVNGNVVAIIHHVADITAEHRAVNALRANEERLRKVLDTETVGVVFFDFVGSIHDANDAFLSMIGYTREELDAGDLRYERLTPPEWRWRDEKTIAELKATGKAGPFEKEYTRKDGTRIWILCADKVLDERTAVRFIIDVTERKRADAALQQSEEQFREFGEASQDILWMRDAETLQWRYLTPAFETIYGLSRAEAMEGDNYRSWLDLVVPEDRDHADQEIARVRAGEHVIFEYRIRRPSDGSIRWLRNTDFPIRNAAGDVVLVGGIGHDFTAVRETEQQLQTLMEGIPQLVWRSGDEGRWTWSSPQWQSFTEQSLAESLGLGWLEAVHPDDRDATMRAWEAAKPHGMLDVEYRVHRAADGEYLWHHTRSVPVRGEGGRIVEWLGTTTDVQQMKELQERQEVMVAELQHRTRNLIAVVRSIAQQTMAQTGPTEAFRDEFNHRLEALARVQGLLSRAEEEPVTIEGLIRMELDALGARTGVGERIELSGPPVRLRNSIVQTLALGLHELATNARKHGALSRDGGRLSVTWQVTEADGEGRRLALKWSEAGADEVIDTAPERRGYGRELIEQALPYALGARTTYEIRPKGVRCTIDLPLDKKERRRRLR